MQSKNTKTANANVQQFATPGDFKTGNAEIAQTENGDFVNTETAEVLNMTDTQEEETGLSTEVHQHEIQNVPTKEWDFTDMSAWEKLDTMLTNADQYTQEVEITATYKKMNPGDVVFGVYGGLAKLPSKYEASGRKDENGFIDAVRILEKESRKMILLGDIVVVGTLINVIPPVMVKITAGEKKTSKAGTYQTFEVKVLTKKGFVEAGNGTPLQSNSANMLKNPNPSKQ